METVVVTSSKIKGDIQTVPIAITALSQEQLTSRQIAGGPDLVKEVPNLTFSKTNFSGYTIQIRGIGTQAISVSTDPAVAVALNDIPFIRNHFFEQEFYDVNQVEVLRGPQGTLYGRNATAGVVNVISAKPTDQFEAMLSADWGNYTNRRYEGMVNIPIVDDRLDLRVAGEWTKRDGYTTNENHRQSGRWPRSVVHARHAGLEAIRERAGLSRLGAFPGERRPHAHEKQLCKTDNRPRQSGPVTCSGRCDDRIRLRTRRRSWPAAFQVTTGYLSQGCLPASLYSPDAFEVPYGFALPYVVAGWVTAALLVSIPMPARRNRRNLRDIESQIDPRYIAKNDTLEFNADYNVTPALTFSSQTGYNETSCGPRKIITGSTQRRASFQPIDALVRTTAVPGQGITAFGPILHRSRRCARDGDRPFLRSATGLQRPARGRRIFRTNMPGNSARNSGWRRISTGRSISASAAIICITKRWKIITSSPIR